ncbi:MAG: DUF2891 family protein [Bowdeniella nasicola]|nr:DUF2891 family protein [Bowdeniella nasicola]
MMMPDISALIDVLGHNITSALPYHDTHFFRDDQPHHPQRAHPLFGFSYDWHSAVNTSWALAALARSYPSEVPRALWRDFLARFTPENIAAEVTYLQANPRYERPYGWAWLLLLYSALPPKERSVLAPLARLCLRRLSHYFDSLSTPVRYGVHSNTAFAATLVHDSAALVHGGDELAADFASALAAAKRGARRWFYADKNYPHHIERNAYDFLSPVLCEAELLAMIMTPADFATWFDRLLPDLAASAALLAPATTRSRDAQAVHWHGLNLSRAGQLARIAHRIPALAGTFAPRISQLFAASATQICGDNYAATHWLPAFYLRAIIYAES